MRVVSAVAEAVEIFGDESKAIAWFKTPSLALGDKRPIDLMTSDPGAKLVRDELLRIRYGHWLEDPSTGPGRIPPLALER